MSNKECIKTDHDLLMSLANDMKWIKLLMTAYLFPIGLVAINSLLAMASG